MSRWTTLVAFLALVGCSGDGDDACGEPPEDYVVSEGAVDHTCEHVTDGPFGDLSASALDATDGPLLENEHMLYTVALPETGDGAFAGTVTFRPAFSSTYVFNLVQDGPVELLAADDGSEPCRAASQALEGCAGLAVAELFSLEAKRTYLVRLGPFDTSTLELVVEEHIATAK